MEFKFTRTVTKKGSHIGGELISANGAEVEETLSSGQLCAIETAFLLLAWVAGTEERFAIDSGAHPDALALAKTFRSLIGSMEDLSMATAPQGRLSAALKKLTKASKRLSQEQGIVARRNARHAVLVSLRAVRSVMDDEFPGERRRRTKKAAKRKPIKMKRIESYDNRLKQILAAGVKVTYDSSKTLLHIYAPAWAIDAPSGTTTEQLRRARRSRTERLALVTLGALVAP